VSRDPIGERGGINLFRAFNDDPVNSFDPNGEWVFWLPKLANLKGDPSTNSEWPKVKPTNKLAPGYYQPSTWSYFLKTDVKRIAFYPNNAGRISGRTFKCKAESTRIGG